MEKEEAKYFRALTMLPEDELSAEEARAEGIYVLGRFVGGKPDRAEMFRGGLLRDVTYFDRAGLDEGLKQQHLARYATRFQLVQPLRTEGSETVRTTLHYTADAALEWIGEQHINARGELLREVRRGPDRSLETTTEYEYDEQGEVTVSRVRNRHGVVISEDARDD